ncbi:hypothetical protein [Arthrobacter sp. H5]|uniref:hypothetical protein n=1 Tax=Arthrobacter sp. H5 TaxID=1267973 RepID=UPI0004B4FB85|nr:hypothetical protein [Arthrobacter sp. H5]
MARTPRPELPPQPVTLKAAIAVWLVVSILFLIAAGSFLVSAQLQEQDRFGLIGLGVLMAVLALLQLFLVLRLRRGKRSARELLSTVGVIVGLPILVRSTPGLSVIAVVMLVAVVPLWLPPSNHWFQKISPKPQNKWVRLVSRTVSPFKKR